MKKTKYFPKEGAEAVLRAHMLSNAEARFVISDYYAAQEARKRADMQLRHLGDKANKMNFALLYYVSNLTSEMEKTIAKVLERFAAASPIGRWIMAQHGVGPVIAAAMLAHLDITRAPTAGHFWSFAGLNPEREWKDGEKRPFNADLKQTCYHFGECAKKSSGSPQSIYGQIYKSRKARLVKRNSEGYNAERAKTYRTKSSDVKKTLKTGLLPAGNLDRQAGNFAAKIFLSHLHGIMYWDKYKQAPPKPFATAILGHAHEIKIPRLDLFPGLEKAYYGHVAEEDPKARFREEKAIWEERQRREKLEKQLQKAATKKKRTAPRRKYLDAAE